MADEIEDPTKLAHDALREGCRQLSSGVTGMHPLVGKVADPTAKAEILKALFEITKQVEVVKKQLQRAERRDESRLL